jgi:hypothetical protein
MKIREIISEAPAGDIGHAVGYTANAGAAGIGTAIGAVAGAPKRIVKGVASGAAAWDKMMSPSQWFSGKGDKADTDKKDNNSKDDATVAQYTDTLNAVAQGLAPNAKDVEHLKKLVPASDPEEQAVLKAAYSGQKLTPEQVAVIKQITYKL